MSITLVRYKFSTYSLLAVSLAFLVKQVSPIEGRRIDLSSCDVERKITEAAVILKVQASFFERDFSCLSKCRQQHSAHRQHGYTQQCRADRPLYKYQGIAAREQHGASEKLFH